VQPLVREAVATSPTLADVCIKIPGGRRSPGFLFLGESRHVDLAMLVRKKYTDATFPLIENLIVSTF
jgi:hypothetical protein